MSNVKPFLVPLGDSTETFKEDLLKGKVVFCTGGMSTPQTSVIVPFVW